jgi:DNA end-binding protein Ku
MIKEKLKGHKPVVAAAPERGNVINLMDALKASLGQAKPPAESKPQPKKAAAPAGKQPAKTAAKAAPARSAAKRKAS